MFRNYLKLQIHSTKNKLESVFNNLHKTENLYNRGYNFFVQQVCKKKNNNVGNKYNLERFSGWKVFIYKGCVTKLK